MPEHRVYVTCIDGRWIVFIPTVNRLYEVDEKNVSALPKKVIASDPLPVSRWDNLGDYQFLGTNLLLTNRCNLGCAYCYEEGGDLSEKITMSPAIIRAAINYVSKCANKIKAPRFYANMFGGEPTQAFPLIKLATELMRQQEKEVSIPSRVTITTNGVMPEEKAVWLADNLDAITISFDGPRDIQNAQRCKSFDRVFATARLVYARSPEKLSFRSTITASSVDRMEEIVRFFGTSFPGCKIFLEPVFGLGRGKNAEYGMPPHAKFFEGFLGCLPIASLTGNRLKTSVLNIGAKSRQFCGVPGNNFMIAPDGRLSVCNRMIYSTEKAAERFFYGHYDFTANGFVFDDQKYQWLKRLKPNRIDRCVQCFASSNCRGDCLANKAVIDPETFPDQPSYRCDEIRDFIGRIFLYVLDHGDQAIEWRT